MNEQESALGDLVRVLGESAARIRELEAEAQRVVDKDPEAYKDLLKDKCRELKALPERAAPHLEELGERGLAIGEELEDFAGRASMALNVDSVFFMYALLYPEDYKPGEPNDLEVFIKGLA